MKSVTGKKVLLAALPAGRVSCQPRIGQSLQFMAQKEAYGLKLRFLERLVLDTHRPIRRFEPIEINY